MFEATAEGAILPRSPSEQEAVQASTNAATVVRLECFGGPQGFIAEKLMDHGLGAALVESPRKRRILACGSIREGAQGAANVTRLLPGA